MTFSGAPAVVLMRQGYLLTSRSASDLIATEVGEIRWGQAVRRQSVDRETSYEASGELIKCDTMESV